MKSILSLAAVLFVSSAALATGPAVNPASAESRRNTNASPAAQFVEVGRSYVDARVEAYSSNTYTIRLERGQWVEIWGHGDGDTDLDLFVYEPGGRQVAADEGYDDSMSVGFEARRSGTYRIQVKNLGDVWNAFNLTVEH